MLKVATGAGLVYLAAPKSVSQQISIQELILQTDA